MLALLVRTCGTVNPVLHHSRAFGICQRELPERVGRVMTCPGQNPAVCGARCLLRLNAPLYE